MAIKKLAKLFLKPAPLLLITGIIVIALCFGVANSLHPDSSGKLQLWFLLALGAAIFVLLCLVVLNLFYLYRQYRQQVVGSKLTIRLISLRFASLVYSAYSPYCHCY